MVSFVAATKNYDVNGEFFDIGTASFPISTWNTNVYYSVNVGSNGVNIRATNDGSEYQGNRYVFIFNAPVGTPVTFIQYNQSGVTRKITQLYDSSSDTTYVEIWLNGTNSAAIDYRIPGNVLNLTPDKTITGSIAPWGSLSFSGTVCYLAGTMIRTPRGEISVDNLNIGDFISTWNPVTGTEISQRIKWIGKAVAIPQERIANDTSQHPVRIKKNALAHNEPHTDLLVTSEHRLYIDNAFVPVRMLVNGYTISYEQNTEEYTYYHIETETHSVIWANGTHSESYLDTGNRHVFLNSPETKCNIGFEITQEQKSVAPLCTDQAFVEPIFARIVERAKNLAPEFITSSRKIVTDFGIELETTSGQSIKPLRHNGQWVTFMLPKYAKNVWLRSNVSRPADTVGPFVDDRRQLGVLVGEIHLFSGRQTHKLDNHLHEANLQGWREIEKDGNARWTSGCACIDLGDPADVFDGPLIISFQIAASGDNLRGDVTSTEA